MASGMPQGYEIMAEKPLPSRLRIKKGTVKIFTLKMG
jgi:hypothetical protein